MLKTKGSSFLCFVCLFCINFCFLTSITINAGFSNEELESELLDENGEIRTDTNAWKIWSILRSSGLSEELAAGIMGNLNQESSFNPLARNKSGAYGIAQWTDERKDQLIKLNGTIALHGYAFSTVEGQAYYLIYELQSQFLSKDFTYDDFMALSDVISTTEAYCAFVERPESGGSEDIVKSQVMIDFYTKAEYTKHTFSLLNKRRESATKIYELYTGKQVTEYSAGVFNSSQNDSNNYNGALMSEEDLGVTETDWYDTAIDLPSAEELELEDRIKLVNWKDDINGKDESNTIKFLRSVVAFVGIIIVVYSTFIYLAYWFDRINNFIDISTLSILTLGRLMISPDDTTSTFNPSTSGTKVVTHRNIIFICLLGIFFGVILLSGKIYNIVYWIISIVKKFG